MFWAFYIYTYPTTCEAIIDCPFGNDGVTKGSGTSGTCVRLVDANGLVSSGIFSSNQGSRWPPASYPHACHTDGGTVWEFDPMLITLICLAIGLGLAGIIACSIGRCRRDEPCRNDSCGLWLAGRIPALVLAALALICASIAAAYAQNHYVEAECTGYAHPQDPANDLTIKSVVGVLDGVTLAYEMLDRSWRPAPASFPLRCYVEATGGNATFMGPSEIMLFAFELALGIVGYWLFGELCMYTGAYARYPDLSGIKTCMRCGASAAEASSAPASKNLVASGADPGPRTIALQIAATPRQTVLVAAHHADVASTPSAAPPPYTPGVASTPSAVLPPYAPGGVPC